MSHVLRAGAIAGLLLGALLMVGGLVLPLERIALHGTAGHADATAWGVGGGIPTSSGGDTPSGSWYTDAFADAKGVAMLKVGGPLAVLGILVVAIASSMLAPGKGVRAGWTATGGLLGVGLGALLLLVGIASFAKSVGAPNAVLDSDLSPQVGFWCLFAGLLLATGATLAAFMVRPEPQGRVGPDGQPLAPLPILSVETPNAFNPMASQDPRPFKPEENPYMSFEVTGGRRTFKPAPAPGEEVPGETPEAWQELESQAKKPAVPPPSKGPAAKPGPSSAPPPGPKPPTAPPKAKA